MSKYIHYPNSNNPLCGPCSSKVDATKDVSRVTCEKCLHNMRKSGLVEIIYCMV